MAGITYLRAVLLCALTIILTGPAFPSPPPRVVVSLKPLHDIAAAVMEGAGQPELLLPGAAATPHGYSLKPSQMRALNRADLVFWIGPQLETFLDGPLAALSGRVRVVSLLETVRSAGGVADRRTPNDNGAGAVLWANRKADEWAPEGVRTLSERSADPHIWLDPVNAAAIADGMARYLRSVDSSNAELYLMNAERFRADMVTLQQRLAARLAPVRERPFIVFHDSYQYLERRFGLRVVGAVSFGAHVGPGAAHLARLRATLVSGEAVCVFIEPQFPPRAARMLVRGTPARLGTLDPLGSGLPQGPDSYPALLDGLADSIHACLQAGRAVRP